MLTSYQLIAPASARFDSAPPSTLLAMVLKLYGPTFIAGGTAVVAMALAEKQIPFELVFVDMFVGEHKGATHCAMQPFGQVPVIVNTSGIHLCALTLIHRAAQDDEGFILFESRAICRYLEEKYPTQGTRLVPTALQEKALFEQAASIEFANFEPYARAVYLQAIVQPYASRSVFVPHAVF